MRRSVADVLAQLRAEGAEGAEGLISDASDERAREALRPALSDDEAPWYLRVALGLGAWIATALILGFMFTVAPLDDDVTRLFVGMVLTAVAVAWHRNTDTDFARHASVAASLAGQALLIASFQQVFDSPRLTALLVVVLAVALIWLVPDRVHRFLSTTAFGVAAFVLVVDEKTLRGFEVMTLALVLITALVWRARLRDRDERVAEMLVPVGYALVTVIFVALLMALLSRHGGLSVDDMRLFVIGRVTTVGIAIALGALAWKVLDEQRRAPGPLLTATLIAIAALGVVTSSSPGIVAGATVMALAFDRGNRVLLGMGVLFLVVFGSAYYYTLTMTLLEKSGVLVGSGLLLLAIRHQVRRA